MLVCWLLNALIHVVDCYGSVEGVSISIKIKLIINQSSSVYILDNPFTPLAESSVILYCTVLSLTQATAENLKHLVEC